VRGLNSAGTAGAWSSVRRFIPGAFTQAASLARIALNPSSVVGGSGSQGTASLTSVPIGTAITLRATNERDVISSGASSSGGNKTKTCTFKLNANAAVTANVQ
jgi:hypothetical protein